MIAIEHHYLSLTFYVHLCSVPAKQCYYVHDVSSLKQWLIEVLCRLQQTVIDEAISELRERLRLCVRAGGAHFEHLV